MAAAAWRASCCRAGAGAGPDRRASAAGPARHRAGPPLHRRPHRAGSKPRPACTIQIGADRRVDLRRDASCKGVRGQRSAGRVPDQPGNHSRLGAAAPGSTTACTSTGWNRRRCGSARCPSCGRPGARGRCCPTSTSTSAASKSTGWSWRAGSAARERVGSLSRRGRHPRRAGDGRARSSACSTATSWRRGSTPSPTATGSTSTSARIAPADGLLPALVGLKRPIDLTIDGDGELDAVARHGAAAGRAAPTRQRLRLAPTAAAIACRAMLAPSPFLKGKAAAADRAA